MLSPQLFFYAAAGIAPIGLAKAANKEESRSAASGDHANFSKVAAMSIMLRQVMIVEAHSVYRTSHTCPIGSQALWRCTDAAGSQRGMRHWGMPWVYEPRRIIQAAQYCSGLHVPGLCCARTRQTHQGLTFRYLQKLAQRCISSSLLVKAIEQTP